MEFYCVRCKKKVEQDAAKVKKTANKRLRATAECPECGAHVSKFVSKEEKKEIEDAASEA